MIRQALAFLRRGSPVADLGAQGGALAEPVADRLAGADAPAPVVIDSETGLPRALVRSIRRLTIMVREDHGDASGRGAAVIVTMPTLGRWRHGSEATQARVKRHWPELTAPDLRRAAGLIDSAVSARLWRPTPRDPVPPSYGFMEW